LGAKPLPFGMNGVASLSLYFMGHWLDALVFSFVVNGGKLLYTFRPTAAVVSFFGFCV